jgi:hypothetical protein
MAQPVDRIPVPWSQQRQVLRERLAPAIMLAATVAACGWLWRQQAGIVPNAMGEVHSAMVEIASPCDGEIQPLETSGDGVRPLFAQIERDDVVVRIKERTDGAADDSIVEMRTPLAGKIVSAPPLPGQFVRRGQILVKVVSPKPDYILCYLPASRLAPPKSGAAVQVRAVESGGPWQPTVVDAVGPAVDQPPPLTSADATTTHRGLPIQIRLPEGGGLTPGAAVEVRFEAASPTI